jgi:hypothetical protein
MSRFECRLAHRPSWQWMGFCGLVAASLAGLVAAAVLCSGVDATGRVDLAGANASACAPGGASGSYCPIAAGRHDAR